MIEEVPAALDGERVDRAVALLTGLTRSQVVELVDGGGVRIDGRAVPARSRKVRAGQTLDIELGGLAGPEPALAGDASVAVTVVWVDDDLIVVDKPAGLVVHPGAGNRTGTMVQGLLAKFPDLASLAGGEGIDGDGAADRPGIVHRLDKGTSGLLVVARTAAARRSLVAQLSARQVERRYATVVYGLVEADDGVIDAPLGRSGADPTRIAVQADGRLARTHYHVESRFRLPVDASRLECRLETGRTHQIRVHLAAIGHPVVGDRRYGGRPAGTVGWPAGYPVRPWLHAQVLGFDHPRTGERLRFVSPLPPDLQAVLDGLS